METIQSSGCFVSHVNFHTCTTPVRHGWLVAASDCRAFFLPSSGIAGRQGPERTLLRCCITAENPFRINDPYRGLPHTISGKTACSYGVRVPNRKSAGEVRASGDIACFAVEAARWVPMLR